MKKVRIVDYRNDNIIEITELAAKLFLRLRPGRFAWPKDVKVSDDDDLAKELAAAIAFNAGEPLPVETPATDAEQPAPATEETAPEVPATPEAETTDVPETPATDAEKETPVKEAPKRRGRRKKSE